MRKARFDREFGAEGHRVLKQMKAMHLLKCTDGYRCQMKVRTAKPKDGVYAFILSD